jgi:hypothetical protein
MRNITPSRRIHLNWAALLLATAMVTAFVHALWTALSGGGPTGGQRDEARLIAISNVLMSGAIIAAVLIGDILRFGQPNRASLIALATCLLALGTGSAVFAIGLLLDPDHAARLAVMIVAGPVIGIACGCGAMLCLKRAFPEDTRRQ